MTKKKKRKQKKGYSERKTKESLLSPPGYKVGVAMHLFIPKGLSCFNEIHLHLSLAPVQSL